MKTSAEGEASSGLRYLAVWVCLVGLTGLSFAASLLHLGSADLWVSLFIAAVKSALVLVFFMHLSRRAGAVWFVPFVVGGFVALLVSLMVTDVATRHTFPKRPLPFPETWEAE